VDHRPRYRLAGPRGDHIAIGANNLFDKHPDKIGIINTDQGQGSSGPSRLGIVRGYYYARLTQRSRGGAMDRRRSSPVSPSGARRPLAACAKGSGQPVLKVGSQRGAGRRSCSAGALEARPTAEWSEFLAAPLPRSFVGRRDRSRRAGDAPFLFAYAGGAKIKAVQAGQSGALERRSWSAGLADRKPPPISRAQDRHGARLHRPLSVPAVLENAGLKPADDAGLSDARRRQGRVHGGIDRRLGHLGLYIALARLHDAARSWPMGRA
jgi:sulfonate transport system substrate-binding protein